VDWREEDEEALVRAFEHLGAASKQAEVMAKQLLKRAVQVSEERGISREEALEELLQKIISARSGE
jgi:hypothetical protein